MGVWETIGRGVRRIFIVGGHLSHIVWSVSFVFFCMAVKLLSQIDRRLL